jgi:hypothetical protein
MEQFIYTYFGTDITMVEGSIKDLINDGAIIDALGIGYGPSPAAVRGMSSAPTGTWHGTVVCRWPEGNKRLP